MAAVKKAVAAPATQNARAQAASDGVGFGDIGMYAAGGFLPEGNYAMEHNVVMFAGQKATGAPTGPARLGVMLTAHSLTDPAAEPRNQFLSMGTNAHLSFAPNPDTGKGIVPIPNAQGSVLNNSTNWFIYLKSMYDCGLPQGIFTGDISVLDGVWVHVQNIPEPEERKGYGAKTAEAAEERQARTIPIVTEIKDDGKPWEGTGGILAAGAAPIKANGGLKAPTPARVAAGAKVIAKAPVKPQVTEITEEDLAVIAGNGVTSVLEKNATGCTHLLLRTGTFKAVQASDGDDMAQLVLDTYFVSPDAINPILGQLGYVTDGKNVKAA